jgi:Ca2+/H+ antiporter
MTLVLSIICSYLYKEHKKDDTTQATVSMISSLSSLLSFFGLIFLYGYYYINSSDINKSDYNNQNIGIIIILIVILYYLSMILSTIFSIDLFNYYNSDENKNLDKETIPGNTMLVLPTVSLYLIMYFIYLYFIIKDEEFINILNKFFTFNFLHKTQN